MIASILVWKTNHSGEILQGSSKNRGYSAESKIHSQPIGSQSNNFDTYSEIGVMYLPKK